jgi:hypothetical protein
MNSETTTTKKLTKLAHKLGYGGTVLRSDNDMAGRYLLNRGSLPVDGLGWTAKEAADTLRSGRV